MSREVRENLEAEAARARAENEARTCMRVLEKVLEVLAPLPHPQRVAVLKTACVFYGERPIGCGQ